MINSEILYRQTVLRTTAVEVGYGNFRVGKQEIIRAVGYSSRQLETVATTACGRFLVVVFLGGLL